MPDISKNHHEDRVNMVVLRAEDFTPEELEKLRARHEFWVDRTGGPDACHLWKGRPRGNGYGEIRVGNKKPGAHRVGYFLAYGELPPVRILHTCNNKLCVNPRHLYAGTTAQNVEDAIAAGTWTNKSNLSAEDRAEMKALYATGDWTQEDLAHIFDTTPSTVWRTLHDYGKPVVLLDILPEQDPDGDPLDRDEIILPDGSIVPAAEVA